MIARGAASGFALGAITGLLLGLRAYPPTAWAAAIELAVPATLVGTVLGGVVLAVGRRRGRA